MTGKDAMPGGAPAVADGLPVWTETAAGKPTVAETAMGVLGDGDAASDGGNIADASAAPQLPDIQPPQDPRILAIQQQLAEIGKQVAEGYRLVAAAKSEALRSDPEILKLQGQIDEKKAEMQARWDAVPEIAKMDERSRQVRTELAALNDEHAELTRQAQASGAPSEEATARVMAIRASLKTLSEELVTLTRGLEQARMRVRDSDSDLIALSADIRRMQKQVAERVNTAPAVSEILARQKQLVDRSHELSEQLVPAGGRPAVSRSKEE